MCAIGARADQYFHLTWLKHWCQVMAQQLQLGSCESDADRPGFAWTQQRFAHTAQFQQGAGYAGYFVVRE